MFFYTNTADAPWTVVKSDDKRRARINCMKHFLNSLDYPDKNEHIVKATDPLVVGKAATIIENDEHILAKSLHPKHGE